MRKYAERGFFMRKHLILISLLSCLALSGCSTASNADTVNINHTEESSSIQEGTTEGAVENKGVDIDIKVERNGGMYRIVISPDFFGVNESDEDIKNEVKSWGAENVHIDPETKAVIVDMSWQNYEKYVNALGDKLKNCMEEIKTNKEKYPSISDVQSNDDLNEFNIFCKKDIKTEKTISAIELYMDSATYQVFSGIPRNQATVTVNYIDEETGDLIESLDTAQLVGK